MLTAMMGQLIQSVSFIFSINTPKLDFSKIIGAYTVVIHAYEQIEIDYMQNKTILSFIQVISENNDIRIC